MDADDRVRYYLLPSFVLPIEWWNREFLGHRPSYPSFVWSCPPSSVPPLPVSETSDHSDFRVEMGLERVGVSRDSESRTRY